MKRQPTRHSLNFRCLDRLESLCVHAGEDVNTKLYLNGVDIYVLQKLTGHKTLSSLLKYVEVSQNRVNQAISCLSA